MRPIKLTSRQLNTVINNINNDKYLIKLINKTSYTSVESFIESALRYLNAIREGRMSCFIESVSRSGMSRNIKFIAYEVYKKNKNNEHTGYYGNFYTLFTHLGFTPVKNDSCFKIYGCGMDMVFHTNYTIIHKLARLGFIDKQMCEVLAQKTPVKF
jgi:hypothetical protein